MPGVRLFFCDPFGRTDTEALFNYGYDDQQESDYVFMHDQEPVHLDLHQPLFQEVRDRNQDLWHKDFEEPMGNIRLMRRLRQKPKPFGHVIVSERGEYVDRLCAEYEWTPHYYFFHGWACLDWFRGYDRSFIMPRARDRQPTRTFMSPNRIIAGKRDHRVLFLYHVFRKGLTNHWLSAPRICAYENVDITQVASKYINTYQDISQVLDNAPLPCLFPGEHTQQMASCWLTNVEQAADSLVYVPTETVFFGKRLHITEKTFKAIAMEMPFVLLAPANSLQYLRDYGFKTFGHVFDESYDKESDDLKRVERVVDLLESLHNMTATQMQDLHRACLSTVEHNYRHFYGGDFANILWQELKDMLDGLQIQVRR